MTTKSTFLKFMACLKLSRIQILQKRLLAILPIEYMSQLYKENKSQQIFWMPFFWASLELHLNKILSLLLQYLHKTVFQKKEH
jgi:hypothetical protein